MNHETQIPQMDTAVTSAAERMAASQDALMSAELFRKKAHELLETMSDEQICKVIPYLKSRL